MEAPSVVHVSYQIKYNASVSLEYTVAGEQIVRVIGFSRLDGLAACTCTPLIRDPPPDIEVEPSERILNEDGSITVNQNIRVTNPDRSGIILGCYFIDENKTCTERERHHLHILNSPHDQCTLLYMMNTKTFNRGFLSEI